jgi:hypothetical protein
LLKKACGGALLLSCTLTGFAQMPTETAPRAPTTTVFLARTGEQLESPIVGTYHFLELLQMRGRWIYPDMGYVDFAHGNYREVFLGAGATLLHNQRVTLIEELYFDQALGLAAQSARYLQPWTMLQFRFTRKLTNETVYFPYLPLNKSARIQHVLERSKFEYAFAKRWKAGVGYGGYKYGDLEWQHKPFLTTTFSTRAGAFEFWLQKMPGGAQVQLRYELVHVGR